MRALNLSLVFIILLSISANASKTKTQYRTKFPNGQTFYLDNCSSCHGDGSRGGNMASIREWAQIFSKNGEELKFFHEEEPSVLKYLNSVTFKEHKEKMLKFMQEFAYDSENIPTCY